MTHDPTTPRPADFDFDLPAELIAQEPLPERATSRLLHVPGTGSDYREYNFADVGKLLRPGDLLVLNDTRVIPARLFGQKATGGRVEMLLERILDTDQAQVQLRSSRSPAVGSVLNFEGGASATVQGRQGSFFRLRFDDDVQSLLEQHGHMPLPPYIAREDEAADRERYQTVYAREPGAVAAPTAGLHFSEPLLQGLQGSGIRQAVVTLHVGAGTFLPLRDEQLQSGRLHSERIEVSDAVCSAIRETRSGGGRVVAVGTTVTRALEAAAADGEIQPCTGETDIFIYPGYEFRVVDAMITNFHLPQSSLLMLVAAFRGREAMLSVYRHAIAERFRFFSYGDAMFIEKPAAENGETGT
ncbi:MAG: tRNA preQ1(34) S-adenosylmethionine ribosyltransferase-isomerase QueA [Gammaproteobacteria bacterium]|nr:tRNA preQ1(34) S-adenosylmethionine ribosyltransferase-isomerase QueA [Gammaproteobacteria bacterium]NND54633.1 tRNA preQ1(34) S-adenosylmethionine ribosyltransferase-isomerase QueA [Gammaproteobacteria bacterium]